MSETDLAEVWARSLGRAGYRPADRAAPAGLAETDPAARAGREHRAIATPNEFVKEQLETRLRALVTQALSRSSAATSSSPSRSTRRRGPRCPGPPRHPAGPGSNTQPGSRTGRESRDHPDAPRGWPAGPGGEPRLPGPGLRADRGPGRDRRPAAARGPDRRQRAPRARPGPARTAHRTRRRNGARAAPSSPAPRPHPAARTPRRGQTAGHLGTHSGGHFGTHSGGLHHRPGDGPGLPRPAPAQDPAEPQVHVRDVRHRLEQPVRARGRGRGRRGAGQGVQPAVHLRRLRPGQDPPAARDRALRAEPLLRR